MKNQIENTSKTGKIPRCKECNKPMMKNGFYSSGKQRWRCFNCGKSFSKSRKTYSKKQDFLTFIDWILNKETAKRIAKNTNNESRMTFYTRNKQFWELEPAIPETGEIHKVIMIDAKYVDGKKSVLLAVTPKFAVSYHWSLNGENIIDYGILFKQMVPPEYLGCDGHRAILSCARRYWPKTRIQRCLVHIRRYVDNRVGKRKQADAGRELSSLVASLFRIKTVLGAKRWEGKFYKLHTKHQDFLNERAYKKTYEGEIEEKNKNKTWWYTHIKIRAAYNHVKIAIENNQLWHWINDSAVPRTTNHLEGGYNARIEELLQSHRGMAVDRRKRIIEWYFVSRSEFEFDLFFNGFL